MIFTNHEINKLHEEQLKPGCYYYGGRYICRPLINGKRGKGGNFKTIKACNKRWAELTGEENG